MVDNKSALIIPGAIILGALLIGGMLLFAVSNTAFKVATVDINEIIKESELGEQTGKELANKRNEVQAKINLAKTDAEKSKLAAEFEKYKSEKESGFTKQVKEIISEVAKKKGLKAVASPQVFIYSERDITEDVIKELDK